MLINNTHCENCGHEFDQTLSRCPRCKTSNKNQATLGYKNQVAFLPIIHQFICILIGLAGLYLFSFIFAACFIAFKDSDPIKYKALLTYSAYLLIFVCLIGVIFPYVGEISKRFSKARPYIAGLIYGVAIIAFSAIYGIIMQKVYPTELNENEKLARQLAVSYPYISIIILCFIGPICEEITYRLGVFSLCSRFNRYVAYVVTILIFALIHFDFTAKNMIAELIYLPSYLVSGFLLTLCYEKEGPAGSITAHIVNNLYSVIGVIIINGMGK